jgi:hypothetical protein
MSLWILSASTNWFPCIDHFLCSIQPLSCQPHY